MLGDRSGEASTTAGGRQPRSGGPPAASRSHTVKRLVRASPGVITCRGMSPRRRRNGDGCEPHHPGPGQERAIRAPLATWSTPTAASCLCTATGSSARSKMPRTCSRRSCCQHGARSANSTAVRSGPGCTALRLIAASIISATTLRRPTRVSGRHTEPIRSDEPWWLEPFPDALLDEAEPGRSPVRIPRVDRTLVCCRPSTAAGTAACRACPPRCPRVLGLGNSRHPGSTQASVNSALQRARTGFRPSRPADHVPLPRSAEEVQVVARFVEAFETGDLDRL